MIPRDCHKKAEIHEEYCLNNCFKFDYASVKFDYRYFPHTEECIQLAKEHSNSFVECHSKYCLNYLKKYGLVPSYGRPKVEPPIKMILEYADEQEDSYDIVDYGNLDH